MIIFTVHRLATFGFLNQQIEKFSVIQSFLAFLTGFFSDIWTSVLGAVFISLLEYLLLMLKQYKIRVWFRRGFLGAIAILAGLHCGYVSFFHFQFIPSHLPYFYDTTFLKGNFGSALDFLVIASLLFNFFSWYTVDRFFKKIRLNRKKEWTSGFIIILLGIGLHTLHNRYKIQWFVPETLQFNFLEGFIIKLTKKVGIPPLSKEDLRTLQSRYGNASQTDQKISQIIIKEQLRDEISNILPIGQQLKNNFINLRMNGKKPLIIVYLMESARYYDMGAYGNKLESISPQFDALASTGILFHKVWSVSNVTRGGQEAVWCGYLSAIDRSLMKERQDIEYKCLTDFPESGASFWHHGGEGRFDNQQWFWEKHHVKSTMSLSQLPKTLPKTGWGTGDLSLAHYSSKAIASLAKSTQQDVITGMVLTVSNHIPWELPADAPSKVNDYAFKGLHPSEKTVYYADHALGAFVAELKEKSLWDRSIVIVTGDHGIRSTALNPNFTNILPDELNSRVPLLITGGVAEATAKSFSSDDRNIFQQRSQADIANFIAQTLGIHGFKSMGEHLFSTKRLTPIFTDLGTSVYFPLSHATIFKSSLSLSSKGGRPSDQLLFYISLLHFLGG